MLQYCWGRALSNTNAIFTRQSVCEVVPILPTFSPTLGTIVLIYFQKMLHAHILHHAVFPNFHRDVIAVIGFIVVDKKPNWLFILAIRPDGVPVQDYCRSKEVIFVEQLGSTEAELLDSDRTNPLLAKLLQYTGSIWPTRS
ncbi:hypothetical protein P692DRAFT_20195782 [Suillus brevipes Sb2]|nr:hypothetical protein P692DRAFT_20195782 [Suillus brevipes Sb2]